MKNRHIIFLLMIIIALIGIILSVTYALNINITENTTTDYDLSYTFDISDNATWTINVEPGKTKIYELTVTNPYNDSIKYGIAYKLENPTVLPEGITIEVPDTSSSLPQDLLEANKTNNIEVEIKNNSTNNIQITLSILTGYKNGGDLIIPDGYVLLTKEEKYYIRGYESTDKTFNNLKYENYECSYTTFAEGKFDCLVETSGNFLNTNIEKALIYSINVIKTNEIPEGVSNPVDVSKNQDNSVLLYSKISQNKGNFDSNYDYYDIYIATKNGKVYLSEGYNMFELLYSLKNIDLSNVYTDDVTNMAGMFALTMSLTDLDLSNFNTSKVNNMSGMFYGENMATPIKNINISSFDTSNVTDMSYMFNYNANLKKLDVSNFDTSKVTTMHGMFHNCQSLTSLDVSDFNTSNVTDMSYMFNGCSSLTNLDVSSFNTSSVTNMMNMFNGCSSLTNLDVSSFNTSSVTNMMNMFNRCSSLTNLNVSNFDTSKVTNMSNMFGNCSSLTNLNVSNFDTSKVTTMDAMFEACKNLTSLDLSSFNTSSVTNMMNMFMSCTNLTTIYASNKFNTANVTSSYSMFENSSKLVGGNGTKYNSSYIDKTYARIDASGTPGYFTSKQ